MAKTTYHAVVELHIRYELISWKEQLEETLRKSWFSKKGLLGHSLD